MVMEGRTEKQCMIQYQKINPDGRFGHWTEEEDNNLLSGIRNFGPKSWHKIAIMVPGRYGTQCRER
jgi:hypothetical protein